MSAAHTSQPRPPPPRALRTTRVAANTARLIQPQPQPQGRSASASSGSQTPIQSFQDATTVKQSTTGAGRPPSSLSLFLRNLRLLDLDLLPDWPGISPDTFASTGSSSQGQKKRIQCVEWALFRLFSLWNPEETANKLKPFFPPLDQVQSLNLRAALLRSLEQAKKNGILGRDALLRKTMLDECRGDRLLDLLAVFSSAVLKKVVTDDGPNYRHPALALKLAIENRGYREDKADLSTLILAHKVSLHRAKEKRQVMDARFRDFSDLLGVKERGVVRRREELRARQQQEDEAAAASREARPRLSENARLEMRRTVRNNWTGDERWMETVLSGDAGAESQNGPFGMPFDRVWRRVQQDRLGELEAKNTGLLEQLDGRVRTHRERLDRWRACRKDLVGDPSNVTLSPSKKTAPPRATKGIDLGFGAHEDIAIGRMSPRKQKLVVGPQVNDEYRSMLDSLNRDLAADEGKPNASALSRLRSRRRKASETLAVPVNEEGEGAISELSDLEDDETDNFTTGAPVSSFANKLNGLKRPNLSRPDTGSWSPSKHSPLRDQANVAPSQASSHHSSPNHSPSPQRRNPLVKTATPGQSPTHLQEGDSHVEPSPTQQLADQILASMNDASPSPSKRTKPRHTLSLAERTRLSMAPRGSSLFLDDDDEPELQTTTVSATTPPTADHNVASTSLNESDGGGDNMKATPLEEEAPEDLVSRTRRSMAGFEAARQKAQLERRRSQRRSKLPPRREGSYFPKLDEHDQEGAALAEDLLQEEDMEAVFRSRPKIKASPLPSPTREMDFEY